MTTIELERPTTGATGPRRVQTASAAPARALATRLPRLVPVAWIAFVVAILVFEPASNADAVVPAWADVALAAFWLSLLGAGTLALLGLAPAALRASALAGCIGVFIGYSCHSTAHHLGAWWLVETACCAGIGLMSGAALVARR